MSAYLFNGLTDLEENNLKQLIGRRFDHKIQLENTLAGLAYPEPALSRTMALFLRAPSYQPRNLLRTKLTKKTFMLEGLNTDFINAQGPNPLAHQWTALHLGDYTAYFLMDKDDRAGELIEFGPTNELFTNPKDKRTEDYITGRFG